MLIPESSSFSVLIDYFTFASWVFYGATISGLLTMRFTKADVYRPFKVYLHFGLKSTLVLHFSTKHILFVGVHIFPDSHCTCCHILDCCTIFSKPVTIVLLSSFHCCWYSHLFHLYILPALSKMD